MIFFSIKENFATTTIGIAYTSYIKDYYLLNTGADLSTNETSNLDILLESIPKDSSDTNIGDPGACMKLCTENSGCNSIKYTKSNSKCVLYKNKPHSNSKQTDIENCDGDVCYYNKNNSIFIPYDDYVETGKKYRKNINHCNPNYLDEEKKEIAFSFIENNDEYIKQCADACRNTSNCKGFNVINNHDNITNNRKNAKFYCQLYNYKCEGGTALTNNMSQNDMFASYDEYTCGDLDLRKKETQVNGNDVYNFYCNNKKIDLNGVDHDFSDADTKKSIIANDTNNYVCLPECNSGGLKNQSDVLIGLKESEFPQFFTL